jgi:hypothetical protein
MELSLPLFNGVKGALRGDKKMGEVLKFVSLFVIFCNEKS